ncbi:IclR family transcriptional regulator C-terminal domain-containing protein [Streptomyces sp. M19]
MTREPSVAPRRTRRRAPEPKPGPGQGRGDRGRCRARHDRGRARHGRGGTRRPAAQPPLNSIAKTLRVLHAVARPDAPHPWATSPNARGPQGQHAPHPRHPRRGGIRRARRRGRYGIGVRLRALAAQVLSDDTVGIEAVLQALQQRLGQAVHLAVLNGEYATYTHKVDPGHAYRIATEVGTHLPLHATAAGKVLLAHLPRASAPPCWTAPASGAHQPDRHRPRAAGGRTRAGARGRLRDRLRGGRRGHLLHRGGRAGHRRLSGGRGVGVLARLPRHRGAAAGVRPAVRQAAEEVSRRL